MKSRTLLSRRHICERLCISAWQSHRLLGKANVRGKIFDTAALDLLREAAVNGQPVGDRIPADLVALGGLAKELGVERRWLLGLIQSRRQKPPHFRLNKAVILFTRTDFTRWLDGQRRKGRKGKTA
jgi:hypothetical protein